MPDICAHWVITCRADRPSVVSPADLTEARATLEMQRTVAPPLAPEARERPPSIEERSRFLAAYRRLLTQACAENEIEPDGLEHLTHPRRSAIQRRAAKRTLQELGLLELEPCTYRPRRAASRSVVQRDSDMLTRLCAELGMNIEKLVATLGESLGATVGNALAGAERQRYTGDGNRDHRSKRRRKGTRLWCVSAAEPVAVDPLTTMTEEAATSSVCV